MMHDTVSQYTCVTVSTATYNILLHTTFTATFNKLLHTTLTEVVPS